MKDQILIDVADLSILAVNGEVGSIEAARNRESAIQSRKNAMQMAIGRAVADRIQWTETKRPDGSIFIEARLACLAKDPRETYG